MSDIREVIKKLLQNPTDINVRVAEILGSEFRKDEFKKGEGLSFEQVKEKYGAYKSKCHNCAFLADSKETKEFFESYPSQMSTILENIDTAVEGTAPFAPFFCHRKMPSNDGGKNFQPELDDEGLPAGHKLCAGWVACVESTKTRG